MEKSDKKTVKEDKKKFDPYSAANLELLKKEVRKSYDADKENYENYKWFNNFIYSTTIDESSRAALTELDRPPLECNLGAAYVARLLGEFEKHEPGIGVSAGEGTKIDPKLIQIVEDHIRHEINEANKNGFQYQSFKNMLSGGFTTSKVWTEYANPMSMEQTIKFGCSFDPTLDGFDPLAKTPHKGDGAYSFTICPKIDTEAKEEYPELDLNKMKFPAPIGGFNWSYTSNKDKIVMLCTFNKKKKIPIEIAKMSDGQVLEIKKAKEFIAQWETSERLEQAPVIIKTRKSNKTIICRYIFCETQVLEYEETDFSMLCDVFGDGDSRYIRKSSDDTYVRKTRPYISNIVGIQRLENLALQSLATEIDNLPQQKTRIMQEALPDQPDYLMAYTKPQKASLQVYKGYKDNDPNVRNEPPMTVERQQIPPEITNTLQIAAQKMQMVLGSYDAEQGINDNDTSGKAIALGAIQSNAAAKPYLIGYLQMLNQIANIYVDLLPKYYVTPRTIPVMGADGKRDFVEINGPGQPKFDYDENALQVKVEAGPSFTIAKTVALQQIIAMSKAMPIFGEFINRKGLEVILDNIEIRGIDQLKMLASEFMQELAQKEQQQQQMQQQEMMNNPMILRAQNERMKIQQDGELAKQEEQIDIAKIAISQQEIDNDKLNILAKMGQSEAEVEAKKISAEAEEMRAKVDMAIKAADMHHKHAREVEELGLKKEENKIKAKMKGPSKTAKKK